MIKEKYVTVLSLLGFLLFISCILHLKGFFFPFLLGNLVSTIIHIYVTSQVISVYPFSFIFRLNGTFVQVMYKFLTGF